MKWEVFFRAIVAIGVIGGGVVVAWGIMDASSMMPETAGAAVFEDIEDSGVEHPVTAVLLNFRAYDTFLEILVLTTAFWGVWSLRGRRAPPMSRLPGQLLSRIAAWLIPVFVVIAVYILWAGSHRPGGEFQAGAVLGAAGILALLVGKAVPGSRRALLRHLMVVGGGATFLGMGAVGWLMTGDLFGFEPGWAKGAILIIEVAAVVSVAFVLICLFAGGVARLSGDVERRPVGSGESTGIDEIEYRDLRGAIETAYRKARGPGGDDDH